MNTFTRELRFVFASLLVLVGAACAPIPVGTRLDSTQTASAPTVAVGDSWTYQVRDGYTGIERGAERYHVEQLGAGNITVARGGTGVADTQLYDSQWNWLKRPATNMQSFAYSPAYPAFNFPLAPGKTWQTNLTATDPADGRSFPIQLRAKVAGWERVKVPAGEFDALKVERFVILGYWLLGERGTSQIVETEWYAPAVKQSVRREARSRYWSVLGALESGLIPVRGLRVRGEGRDDGGPRYVQDDWLIYELVSYTAR
jgi:hypothetical protein